MRRRPLRDQARAICLDLCRPTRDGSDGAGEFGDLSGVVECVTVSGERGDPAGIGAGGQLALGVDDGVQFHRDAGVEVRPLAVRAEHLDVQPQMTVDVRVERARAAMLQLDDLDAGELLANEPPRARAGR